MSDVTLVISRPIGAEELMQLKSYLKLAHIFKEAGIPQSTGNGRVSRNQKFPPEQVVALQGVLRNLHAEIGKYI